MIAFYTFMLIVTMLVPAMMLFFGYRWQKKPPATINTSYGYRTKRSMSCQEAWNFAHTHCGETWVKLGWFTVLLSAIAMVVLPFFTLEIVTTSMVGTVVVILQLVPLVTPLIATERALKRKFRI